MYARLYFFHLKRARFAQLLHTRSYQPSPSDRGSRALETRAKFYVYRVGMGFAIAIVLGCALLPVPTHGWSLDQYGGEAPPSILSKRAVVIALVVILVSALWKMYPPAQHLDAWIASTFAVTLAVTVLGAVLCYITNDIDLDGDEDMVDFARQFFDIDGDGKTSSFEASLALFLVSAALGVIVLVLLTHVKQLIKENKYVQQMIKENKAEAARLRKITEGHTTERGKFKRKATALQKRVEDAEQAASLQSELLRTEKRENQLRQQARVGVGIAPAVAAKRRLRLNTNERGAGIYTAISGELEYIGLHAILDTGNAAQTMISRKVAMRAGLITPDGKPNQATKATRTIHGVVSGASEKVWQVHAKIVIRTNPEELAKTTLEGMMCVSQEDKDWDILVSESHIKELQQYGGYGGVRCD